MNEALTLAERVFVCQTCGLVEDRDLNAAINLRNEALRTASSAGTDACGVGGSGSLATESETAHGEAGTNPHLGLS
ncbi:MAG: zinc ribbon domain-containing protein [Ktedonobacteraceae bacterium]